ncbi:hypothetical protein C8J56DRAFT_1061693 [Mycena floridula]|nr:hypothetical protein C8J56DRAFT_1061693 [Mycena floridula]
MVVRFLSNPADAQIEEGVSVLLSAFKEDELLGAMTGGDPLVGPPLVRAMIKAASLEGFILVATSEGSEAFESMAIGFPPGVTMYGSEAQRSVGWNQFWESLSPERQAWWKRFQTEGRHSDEEKAKGGDILLNSWHIDILGTLSECRGRGNASAIVKVVQAKAVETKKSVSLTTNTEINLKLYKKMGFTVIEERTQFRSLGTKTLPSFNMIWRSGEVE